MTHAGIHSWSRSAVLIALLWLVPGAEVASAQTKVYPAFRRRGPALQNARRFFTLFKKALAA